MSRQYRGNGQPAREFSFGGPAAAPQPPPQPQQPNRFQPLRGGRGGGGACYTCGQQGHVQRDCPQSRAQQSGGGVRQQAGAARVSIADVKRAVAEDMRESPPWPFSCYAPDAVANVAGFNLLAGDVSFEEARAAAYSALATGGPQAVQASSQRLAEAAQWRQNDRRRLADLPQPELARQLQAAAAGQAVQAVMPQLDWSFPAGAAVAGAQTFVPPPPPQSLPSLFPTPQAQESQFVNYAAQQQAEQQRMQQQQQQQQQLQQGAGGAGARLLQQYVGNPLPAAIEARNAAPPPAASDAECWIAPAFRHGGIPETPPPAQFA